MPGRFNGFPSSSTNLTTQFNQAGIQCNLNGFPPNLTTQFIEVMPGRIGHHLPHMPGQFNGFQPNLTNSTTQFDQAGIQCNLNGFPPNLTTQFIEVMPGRIGHHLPHMPGGFNGFQPNSINLTTQFNQAGNVISMDFPM